ncbi:MAG: glycerol kinase [Actinobacteria bacterium ATB1]|nr:glycerol kinase [Actinobacteria bacterium ATB1]
MGHTLVIDLGTTSVRGVIFDPEGNAVAHHQIDVVPSSPAPGLVEQDATELVDTSVEAATAAVEEAGLPDVTSVGLAVQRATTVVWDASSGDPVGPAIGWQDLRTLGECLALGAKGIRMAPNQSGTKVAWLARQAMEAGIPLDRLRFGTLDTWLAWKLSGGRLHVTDPTNAGVTGLVTDDASEWDEAVLTALDLPASMLPSIVPTSGVCGEVRIGAMTIPLGSLVGDQQASLVGQGGLRENVVKTTYGTACMTDVNVGSRRPSLDDIAAYPIVVASTGDSIWFGLEATVITGGETVRELVDLGVVESPAEVSKLAAEVEDSGGVRFVPALLGLGTPYWDYGARGTVVGMSLGTDRRHLARASLEGIAARVTECVREIEHETGVPVEMLRVDGGAATSDVLCQSQADMLGVPVERSAQLEATALGAALLAALAVGELDLDAALSIPEVERVFEPTWDETRRRDFAVSWQRAIEAARSWIPEMSAIRF